MIPRIECKIGYLYRVRSRNLTLAIYNGTGFVGIREKFGDEYLFEEYHHDDGPPFGTVVPMEELCPTPYRDECPELFTWLKNYELAARTKTGN